MRKEIWLQTPTVFWLGSMYKGLVMLGRHKYIQQKHQLSEPRTFEVEMVTERLKRFKSPGIDQISTELIKQGVEKFALIYVNLLILLGIKRNCLRSESSRSLCRFIRKGDKTL
jgi:hypothetical protein